MVLECVIEQKGLHGSRCAMRVWLPAGSGKYRRAGERLPPSTPRRPQNSHLNALETPQNSTHWKSW